MILGIDEVGRGPWAGPLVVGAVVLGGAQIQGLTDSKKLTAKRRQVLDLIIREQAASFGLGWVHAEELDQLGLAKALRVATIRAVEAITVPYHEIIIDGTINFLSETTNGSFVTTLPKADLLVPSVSAASILAKVARDAYMAAQDDIYPGYSFGSHVGYGTAAHKAAIDSLGITPLHRKSFAPIARIVAADATKRIGDSAEMVVAKHMEALGWTVLQQNWRTKFCEIDIICTKNNDIAFIEVKHRRSSNSGDGLAAITAKKLQQMRFAAEFFLTRFPLYADRNTTMLAVSTSGVTPRIDQILIVE